MPLPQGPRVADPLEPTSLERLILLAICDPGAFLKRGDNYSESIQHWGMRAVLAALAREGKVIVDPGEAAAIRDAKRTSARLRDLLADLRARDEALLALRDKAQDHKRALGREMSASEVRRIADALEAILSEGADR